MSAHKLEVIPLGAGCEVGRSCVLLRFRGLTVMFDCGLHPAFRGISALPFLEDACDLSEVDVLLVTHFHLDHCGAVPYLTEKTNFKGRVFMTHATKAIYKIILHDYVRVSAQDDRLFDERDLMQSMAKIEVVDYHQVVEFKGIKFWSLNAGHVLGAAMFMVEIAGVRTLYTGDFSRDEDRHLKGAETPVDPPHVLIIESTYGGQQHEPAAERERLFKSFVHEVVARGGRCLIPVFALGRAQELLLILGATVEREPRSRRKMWPLMCLSPPCARRRVLEGPPGAALRPSLLRIVTCAQVHEGVPRVHQHDERSHPQAARAVQSLEIHACHGAEKLRGL